LEKDRTVLFYLARSLIKMQALFGIIPKILGKGFAARAVADMMIRMRKEQVRGVGR
jgi:vacuolar protein sorting-associated protein 33A